MRPPLSSAVDDLQLCFLGADPCHLLLRELGRAPASVAEIGSASGKLSIHLLLGGARRALLVDPDPDMRDYSAHLLAAAKELVLASGQKFEPEVSFVEGDGRDLSPLGDLAKDALYELVWNEGVCFPPGTLVHTFEHGYLPIEQIKVGMKVLTHKGRYRIVLRTMTRRLNGNLVKISSSGMLPISATPEHPFLTTENGWMQARELEGKHIVLPAVAEDGDIDQITPTYRVMAGNGSGWRGPGRTISATYEASIPLMRLIGYYLSEGCPGGARKGGHDRIVLNFGDGDEEKAFADEAAACALELGLSASVRSIINRYGTTVYRTTINGAPLSRWLAENFGRGAGNKRIPPWLLRLPAKKLEAIADAYFLGDGHHPDGTAHLWKANTVSKALAYGMRDICLRIGWSSCVLKLAKAKNGFGTRRRQQYGVLANMRGDDAQCRIRRRGGFVTRVAHIASEAYEGPVHNLEVEEDNSYCTADAAVHNCEHFSREDQVKFLKEMARLSNKWVCFIVPDAADAESQRIAKEVHHHYVGMPAHETPLTVDDCRSIAKDAGLSVLTVQPCLKRFHLVLCEKVGAGVTVSSGPAEPRRGPAEEPIMHEVTPITPDELRAMVEAR